MISEVTIKIALQYFAMWYCVVCQIGTDVSKEPAAFILRPILPRGGGGGSRFLRNVGIFIRRLV
jgi:hypothetical protein